MDPYLRRLADIPPLAAASEHELAVRSWRGDSQAREELITASLRLVVMRARLFGLQGSRLLDAVQSGTVGLIEAVDRFDPYRGCRLSTYAWWWIGRSMRQSLPRQEFAPQLVVENDSSQPMFGEAELLEGLDEELSFVLKARFGMGVGHVPPASRVEVARRLGLTVSQVRTREAKAIEHVRKRLAKVGHRAPQQHRGADPL